MNDKRFAKIIWIAIASAGLLFAGCAKKSEVAIDGSAGSSSSAGSSAQVSGVDSSGSAYSAHGQKLERSVYFAFDKSDLNAAARAVLDAQATWLTAHSNATIKIEGNCDERGSREYNLALGQQRADSVGDYLTARGVNSRSIETISFGEEMPVCTRRTGESCWAQNRRADIVTR